MEKKAVLAMPTVTRETEAQTVIPKSLKEKTDNMTDQCALSTAQ